MAPPSHATIGCPLCATDIEVAAAELSSGEATVACSVCLTSLRITLDGTVSYGKVTRPLPEATQEALRALGTEAPAPLPVPASVVDVTEAIPELPEPVRSEAPAAAPPVHEAAAKSAVKLAAASPAFEGSIAKLPIVDVLQLLHANRKTGLLTVQAEGLEAQLWFKEGRIFACQHPVGGVAIGERLIKSGAVTEAAVNEALSAQTEAGAERKPLVQTLVDLGKLDPAQGHRVLKRLVESVIVAVLRWTDGRFLFIAHDIDPPDDFRHVAEFMTGDVRVDTQTALMEALQQLDEGDRGGPPKEEAADADFALEWDVAPSPAPEPAPAPAPAPAVAVPSSPNLAQRLLALRKKPAVLGAAGAVLVGLIVLVVILARSGPPATAPVMPAVAVPAAEVIKAAPPPAPAPAAAEDDAKHLKRGKKAKQKSARGLFDAALQKTKN